MAIPTSFDHASSRSLPLSESDSRSHDDNSPVSGRALRPNVSPLRFAHPAEAEIARLLDFNGIRWQYEPTTFTVRTCAQGLPVQSFTPDFYLPDENLYIEMTTMRQSFVTRKNRKFRLLRELYPQLNVKLLYRKDVELILDRYTSPHAEIRADTPLQRVIRGEQIERRCTEMAEALLEPTSGSYCLLALGASSVHAQALIGRELKAAGKTVTNGLLIVQRFGKNATTSAVRLETEIELDLNTSTIVVVADIVGTGLTALTALRWMRGEGANRIRLVALLDRRSSRLVDVPLEISGFIATSSWHVGAGLGQHPSSRELPDMHIVLPSVG